MTPAKAAWPGIRAVILALAAAGMAAGSGSALADDWKHGLGLVETPKYEAGFSHFDYVNPDAPKGGSARLSDTGTFDSFNVVPTRGSTPLGLGHLYDTLMTPSQDEDSVSYGLLAEAVSHPEDFSSVTYRLREEARWHDGEPVTPEDVIWSFEQWTTHNPQQEYYYRHIVKAEKTGPLDVTFTFDEAGNRELPYITGQLVILPRHWWEASDADGNARDISKGTLEPPLGSGPYRISGFTAGRSITYERVPDYWGKDLNVSVGTHNFDELTYEYFRDLNVEFEGFKADAFDWWRENEAKRWATQYDFPAVAESHVIKELFENPYRNYGLMVGFIPNLRLEKFKDPAIRQALRYAFDFEGLNQTIFYNQYEPIDSYFYGLPFRSSGLPEGRELEILETVRADVPESVFTTPYAVPVGGQENMRENLRTAYDILQNAGYTFDKGKLIDPASGRPFEFELLLNGPTIEKVANPFAKNLERIGITMTVRSVDSTQYTERLRNREFEMIYLGWAQSYSPGNEQRDFFGSEAADRNGSRNYGGVKNPAIDALIDTVIFAKDRAALTAAVKALDRVLLWNHYIVPTYTLRKARIARWDRFSHPENLPEYAIGFPDIWWFDEEKAARISSAE